MRKQRNEDMKKPGNEDKRNRRHEGNEETKKRWFCIGFYVIWRFYNRFFVHYICALCTYYKCTRSKHKKGRCQKGWLQIAGQPMGVSLAFSHGISISLNSHGAAPERGSAHEWWTCARLFSQFVVRGAQCRRNALYGLLSADDCQ